jgi:hypothetical protein
MKKVLSVIAILIFSSTVLNAQTIVSTTPSNRNVILEEYTGIHCTWCPDGHKRANQLIASNPGRVWAINIHQGGYASPGSGEPDYRTQWGDALAGQTGLTGYPSGTINRQVFSGSATALGRGDWPAAAAQVLAVASPVNVAATAAIDFNTRELVVNVEAYYTANSSVSTNFLNVALVQDNILGPQTGASSLYPEMMEGNLYRHNHMLRHLLTDQWGEEITTTTTGSFVSKQYTYTIPAHLNNVEYILEDLRVIVFVTESHQYIITGNEASMTFTNALPRFSSIKEKILYSCDDAQFYATVKNLWDTQDITSADFEYSYNGDTYSLSWNNRSIGSGQSDTILFPKISLTSGVALPITVSLTALNGNPFDGGTKNISLQKTKYDTHKNPVLKLYTDRYASETVVYLYNSAGQVLLTRGPWSDLSANGTTERIIPLPIEDADCYKLVITDTYGDGINSGYGAGHVDIVDAAGNLIVRNNGQFGSELDLYFVCDGLVSVKEMETVSFSIYPNPSNHYFNIVSDEVIETVSLINMFGQIVRTDNVMDSHYQMNVENLAKGMYVIRVNNHSKSGIQKVVIE